MAGRIFDRMRFRTKIEIGIAALVMVTALLLALAAGRIASDALKAEHHRRGLALAEILATRAVEPLLARDLLRLKNIVDDLKKIEGDVLYAFTQDENGHVMAHSFPGGFPEDLLDVNRMDGDAGTRTRLLVSNGMLLDDFAASVSAAGGFIGTARLGISRVNIQAAVNRLHFYLILIALGVLSIAVTAGTVYAKRITARINILKHYADEVVRGNLDLQTGPTLVRNCWEIMNCGKVHCPAYGDIRRRCWHMAGTLCEACDQGRYPEKLDSCRSCRVYQQNGGDEIQDLAETFDVMALILKSRIDDLKQVQESLQSQQQLMRTILDETPDLVSLLDANLAYRQPNKAFAVSLGRTVEEVVGRTDADLFPPEVAALRVQRNMEVMETRRKAEMESVRELGNETRWYHTVIIPVTDRNGLVTGVLRTARDVTEFKIVQEQLIQAQKMESVGKLAGGVAHEINTPLGIILGYAQLLMEDVPSGSQMVADLQIIEKQARVCRKIVADLLGYSRQSTSAKQDMCLNNTIMESVSLVRHTFDLDRVRIMEELDDRMPIIYGDPEKLKQVWLNMLNNARDVMPDGGIIKVRSQLDVPAHKVRIWLADTGSGVSKDNLNRIFDPFFTTKSVDKGTGLGLAVSFGIIKDHGGRVGVKSPARDWFSPDEQPENLFGPGTVFEVELPLDSSCHYESTEAEGEADGLYSSP
jgi:PAS domain S-box-containing protein